MAKKIMKSTQVANTPLVKILDLLPPWTQHRMGKPTVPSSAIRWSGGVGTKSPLIPLLPTPSVGVLCRQYGDLPPLTLETIKDRILYCYINKLYLLGVDVGNINGHLENILNRQSWKKIIRPPLPPCFVHFNAWYN
uniref:Uncharacterized protein n=1 Tax=Acanthochromis polyacanthus TaxID=80966 RepID=A0A3Q1FNZ4_9TELE